jgi:hypothetical protein
MEGGDFFALSDDQLQRLLAGQLDHAQFLAAGGGEQPRERWSEAAQVWYELSQVLGQEGGCGKAQTARIPEMAGYSSAAEVAATAGQLAALGPDAIRTRCESALMEASVEQVQQAVQGLTAFFQRAAAAGDAVLFRVR